MPATLSCTPCCPTSQVVNVPGIEGPQGPPGPTGPPGGGFVGSLALGDGVDSGSVTGLAIPFVPTAVASLSISRPAGGLMLFACDNAGTLTNAGFDFELSGVTDSVNYVLNYVIV